MCGIAGIAGLKNIEPAQLINMSRSIRHRGPDDEGYFVFGENTSDFLRGDDSINSSIRHITQYTQYKIQLGLVHRRLSILDLSEAGHQPMKLPDFSGVMIYNGEVYNYKEIREELRTLGYSFFSDSDSEVILRAFAHWGAECVQKFTGMWAFAIFLPDEKKLFFSRDRFGIKPLYFHQTANALVFASEIKAIISSGVYNPESDEEILFQYLVHGKISDERNTLFKNVFQLPQGYNMLFDIDRNELSFHQYYDLEKSVTSRLNGNEKFTGDGYLSQLQHSIRIHLRSDVPVGSCLSGGLDSSLIVSLASKITEGNFNTFTAVYKEKEIDESYFAKQVIASSKNIIPHFTEPSAKQYWHDIDKLIWHQDQPIASTSMYSQWEVMKLAGANGAKVLLDGQGADETLGGYANFSGIFLLDLLLNFRWLLFLREQQKLREQRTINPWRETGRAFFYRMPPSLKILTRKKVRIGDSLLTETFKNNFQNTEPFDYRSSTFRETSLSSVKFGLQELLRYEDRNSMAFSIESRVPFLEHKTVEYAICLNDSEKLKNGWTKYPLRQFLDKQHLPEVAWRKDKKGFITPQKKWINELKPELTSYLNEQTLPSFINKKQVLNLLDSGLEKNTSQSEFWKMFSVLKWFEVFKLTV